MKNQIGLLGGRSRWCVLLAMTAALSGWQVDTALAQWTQWGGPDQEFKAPAKDLAAAWPEGGPKKVWDRALGEGYTAILVDDGKLYTMYRDHEADKEVVIAMDAASGKTVWEYKYDAKPAKGHTMQFGDGPRSTPCIVGDRLYTIGISGSMHCLNKKDGKPIWHKELWNDMKGNTLPHGYSSSPIAYQDKIIVLVGANDNSIVAFNQSDGSIAWKSSESFENSYSTPKIMKVGGKDELITFMATEIVGLNPNSGEVEWKMAQANQWKQNVCMPVIDDNDVLVFSSPVAGTHGVKLTRKDGKVDVEKLWSQRKVQFYHGTSIRMGDYVYGFTGGATGGPAFFAAVNINDGKIAWRKRGFAKATVIEADGRMIILDEDGVLALATATPDEFKVVSKFNLMEKVAWTVPTLVGDKLYVRDKKNIMALDLGEPSSKETHKSAAG